MRIEIGEHVLKLNKLFKIKLNIGDIVKLRNIDFQWFDLVVLLRTNDTVLFDRLKERGYPQKKITENIECEILEVTKEEVERQYDNK